MDEGTIKEEGNAKELVTVEHLKSIYGDHLCASKDLGYQEISFKE